MLGMAIEGGKTAGWPIPPDVKEDFTTFCKDVGTLAKDDCAGALFVWQYLPAQIREWAKLGAKGIKPVDGNFWAHFGAGMGAYIQRGFLDFLTGSTLEADHIRRGIDPGAKADQIASRASSPTEGAASMIDRAATDSASPAEKQVRKRVTRR